VVITRKREIAARYLDYLRRELALVARSLGERRRVVQYHWGGGTPTYLSVDQMQTLHAAVADHFEILPDAEVAIEVDPRVTSVEQLETLRRMGFNRLSMGVQDFTPEVQAAVNRIQPEDVTRRLFDEARRLGFESINIDLIYGLPLQTPASFGRAVDAVVAMRPDRASLFVVGDITEAQVRTLVEQHFGAWRATGAAIPLPAPPAAITPTATTRVWLVDKPEAAQSVIMIGWPGVERTSPDYAALQVMNTLLGGSFTSRLNMNLRETKGYSYGAGSGFSYRVVPGPFIASSSVRTNVTDSSLVEIFKELRGVRDVAVPEDELNRAKAYVELGIPGTLESTSQVAGQMALLATFGLTLDELPRLAARVRAVTAADVQRVAREYLTPDRAHVVVVGDLAKVKTPIEQLGLGTATTLEVSKIAR